jgi:hypothetical protein
MADVAPSHFAVVGMDQFKETLGTAGGLPSWGAVHFAEGVIPLDKCPLKCSSVRHQRGMSSAPRATARVRIERGFCSNRYGGV